MAVARRLFAGGAVQTTLVSPISASDLTITIVSDTGYPSGAEEFFVVIDPDQANEEKVLVTRSGTTLSAASTGKRGVDGTAAATHAAGAVVYPCVSATDLNDANRAAARLTSGSTGQVAVSSADDAGFDWVTFGLDDLDDVDASAPSDGDILQYDNASGDWLAAQLPTPTVASLTDVDLTGLGDGDILQYDNASGDWLAVALPVAKVVDFASGTDTTGASSTTFVDTASVSFTPKDASNILLIEASAFAEGGYDSGAAIAERGIGLAIRNATAGTDVVLGFSGRILVATSTVIAQTDDTISIRAVITAGSTAARTYQLRLNAIPGNYVFNQASSSTPAIITVTEFTP